MANLNKNEKNSIKLLMQAYASILEAFPRFFNHYQERLHDSYTLTWSDNPNKTNVIYTNNKTKGSDELSVSNEANKEPNDPNRTSKPDAHQKTNDVDVNFCRDILHDDRIAVITGEEYTLAGLERKLNSHGIPYDKVDRTLLGDDFKAYSSQVLIIRIVDYKTAQAVLDEHISELQMIAEEKELKDAELERERENIRQVEEEPEETEVESEEVQDEGDTDDLSFEEDDEKSKSKKNRETAESTPTPTGSGSDDGYDSYRYEPHSSETSSYNQIENVQERGFQTSRGLSLRENNVIETERSSTQYQEQSYERQKIVYNGSSYGNEAREFIGNNDSRATYESKDAYVGSEINNVTNREFSTSRGTSLRDNNRINNESPINSLYETSTENDKTENKNPRRTVSGNKDDLSGRKNITQIIDFNELTQWVGSKLGDTNNNFGERKLGSDPLTKLEEAAKRYNPNITGESSTSVSKKELYDLFSNLNSNEQDTTSNKNQARNVDKFETLNDRKKATPPELPLEMANYKVNTHTIDFTKEILQKRFENTIFSLNNMKSLHKVGHIVARMTVDSMAQNLEGHEILREAYAYTAPVAKFAVGRLVADGAVISNTNTYISQNVFRAMFEENSRLCGVTDAASIAHNDLLLDKLLHKNMTDMDLAKLMGIDEKNMDAFKRVHEKLLKGKKMEKTTLNHLMARFGLKDEDIKNWVSMTQGPVNFQKNDSLMKTLMGARNGGFASMAKRFKLENFSTVIGNLNTTMDSKKLLLAITQENMQDMALLNGLMKKLKRMSNTEEAQDYVNMLMEIHRQNTQKMPKFSMLLGSYFKLMMRKGGGLVRDTDFGHGLNHVMKSIRGLSSAYNSMINLVKAYSRMAARLNPRLEVKAVALAKKLDAATPKVLANNVANKFGWNKAKAKFAEKATAKMAAYLSKLPGSTVVKQLVAKITNSATYQALAMASSSASSALSSVAAVFWEVVAVILIIVLLLSAFQMFSDEMDRREDEAALMTSSKSQTKNGTLANGILADKDDLLTSISTELKSKNEEFMETVNQALNNRGTMSFQVGLTANENVEHYEAERVVVRDAYGNELQPNQLDLNNTEAIISMASRYIPYDFTISENASDEKKIENDQMRQYFKDYCYLLWASTHQITIEEYRPGNSSEQVKGTDDAEDTSGMTTDAETGTCFRDGTVMWLQESYTPNIVTEKDDEGNEITQQCSTCDEPITNGTGMFNAGLCSHPKDDDLDTVSRIDGWRRTEEWRWAVNCLHGYSSKGNGDHDHKIFVGYDEDGDPEYEHETEECMLSPATYGDSSSYAYDSTGKGGSFHIHESDHIHKEYKWVYECGGHMGVVVYITVGDLSRLPSMPAANDIDYDLVGKYVKYDPEALKRRSSVGGVIRLNGIKRGKNWGLTKPYNGTAWPLLSDQEIRKITAACYNEQGTLEGVIYEASLLARLCDEGSWGHEPSAVIQSTWFHWTTHQSYRECKPYYGGTVTEEMVDAVKKILRGGERILDCDEHDSFGDIKKIVTNGVVYTSKEDIRNRDNYIPGETLIYNGMNSVYRFITFAVAPGIKGDPFGTKDLNVKLVFDDDDYCLNGYDLEGDEKAIETAIAFAKSKFNIPYSQNYRTTGRYYDCSSFVYYAYEEAGLNIGGTHTAPATAADECALLEQKGRMVSDKYNASVMQPGDLIFWSTKSNGRYKNITHVGLYIGNGRIVHASATKGKVIESAIEDFGNDPVVSVCRPA